MKWLAFLLLFTSIYTSAAIDTYQFTSDSERSRFQILSEELRCPKCQNQNLADSNSPIAADLRAELYRMVIEGRSDIQIKEFMVSRYGDFVLYRPPVNATTYALWYGPYVLLACGVVLIFAISWRRKGNNTPREVKVKNQAEQNELKQAQQHKKQIAALLESNDD